LKRFTLGFSLVAGFSIGLALTLVTVGVVAAWGMNQSTKQVGFTGALAHKAPYFSSAYLVRSWLRLRRRGAGISLILPEAGGASG
jgi:nickel/cobalt exporter